jgi:hypothetical protein
MSLPKPAKIAPALCLCYRHILVNESRARDQIRWVLALGASIEQAGGTRKRRQFIITIPCRKPSRWRAVLRQAVRQIPEGSERDWFPALHMGYDQDGPVLHPLSAEQADDYGDDPSAFLASFDDDAEHAYA